MKQTGSTAEWLFKLRRKIILGLLGILVVIMITTMLFILVMLRTNLLENSKIKTNELSHILESSMEKLMVLGNPLVIQEALENIGGGKDKITSIFIIDKNGTVVHASDHSLLGKRFEKSKDRSCNVCHVNGKAPDDITIVLKTDQGDIYRNVNVIFNKPACYGCHPQSDSFLGKLIIDQPLRDIYALILKIEIMIIASGIICLLLLILFLSKVLTRGLDKYISEIIRQNTELSFLYSMIERLSKTIDVDELKQIVIDIFRDTLDADEIDIVMKKEARELRCTSWRRSENKYLRKKIDDDTPLLSAVNDWQAGSLTGQRMSPDKREIIILIKKNDIELALVRIRKNSSDYDAARLNLIDIIVSHVSVAFENARLYYIAITDELTHLFTQRHFRFCIDREFTNYEQYGQKLTLLLIDIDNFKKVNDTYGHPVGDIVLEGVARCIIEAVRDNDMPFRYGGEEFTILLPSTDSAGGQFVAKRIREHIAETVFDKGNNNLRITVSIGVSNCPANADNIKDLIVTADKALYEAKHTGKNRVVLAPSARA